MLSLFALLLTAACLVQVNGTGYMSIQFLRYNNHDSRCQDGTFCDSILFFNARESACDPMFRLTADKNNPGGTSIFNYQQPNDYPNQDIIDFGSTFGTISNPVIISMNYNDNQGSIHITVTVMDKDTTQNDLIDVFASSLIANGGGVRDLTMYSQPMAHSLTARYWFTCHSHYYGSHCNTYCVAQNDAGNGHYTCDSNGQKVCLNGWIDPSTNCKTPHPCTTGVCQNGGICTVLGESYACTCPADYTGTNCQQFLDPCQHRNPCKNSAPCYLDAANQPKCRCPTQFTGSQCDLDVNECLASTNPCSNSMLCVNTYGGFTCNCTDTRFAGTLCEISVCNGTVCQNNGTCSPGADRLPRCVCLAGFTGVDCGIDVNDCASNPCRNGATCRDLVANFTCDCPMGFDGRLCERNPDDCLTSPCQNGGNCTDGLANFTCTCPLGFGGLRCELNLDDCVGLPCKNGGTCVDGVASFKCTCPNGFSGATCDPTVPNANVVEPLSSSLGAGGGVSVVAIATPICAVAVLLLVGLAVYLARFRNANPDPQHSDSNDNQCSNEAYGTYDNLEGGQTGSTASLANQNPEESEYSTITELAADTESFNNGVLVNETYGTHEQPHQHQEHQSNDQIVDPASVHEIDV